MRNAKQRVVVTGMGVVCPVGNDVASMWESLLAGRSGIGPLTKFSTEGLKVRIGGELKNFNPADTMDSKEVGRVDPFTHFAMAAATQAFKDSGLNMDKEDRYRCGAVIGTGTGGFTGAQEQHKRFLDKMRISPFFIPKMMHNAAAGHIAIRFGLGGPNFAVASACASASHAVTCGLRLIQQGDADALICGGSEAVMSPLGLIGFTNIGALSDRNDAPEKASRPFDRNRNGFALSEGAAMLMLERLDHALKREARIYAEILGAGNSHDSYHILRPQPDGAAAAYAMQAALKDAGLRPEQISYINAHGLATVPNDRIETAAIKQVFGDAARRIPISATKSMTGHLLGASGAVELIATILAIRDGVIHPTINYETPDPECDLDYVPNVKRAVRVDYALSNSMGFGGHNSMLVVGKYDN